MGRFDRVFAREEGAVAKENGVSRPEIKKEAAAIIEESQDQDQYWHAVLTNAHYLHYPGPDGSYKNAEPMRPLWVMLKALKEMGAELVKVKKKDGSAYLKLVQGSMPAEKWEEIRGRLARYRDKLLWLFTLSVVGVAVEECELGRKIEMEFIAEMGRRIGAGGAGAAEQMKLDLTG